MRAARRRLSYEAWHGLHLALYVAVGLGLVHQGLDRDEHVAGLLEAESELLAHAVATQRARIAATGTSAVSS